MKNTTLTISKSDYDLLQLHLEKSSMSDYNKAKLSDELKGARVLKDKDLPDNVVAMNSIVEIQNIENEQKFKFQLVLPGEANFKSGKVSVFAPIGIALLGYSVNSEVQWEMPDGLKTFRILRCEHPPKE
jgi:regulator of nucleoside diphosphate kinase